MNSRGLVRSRSCGGPETVNSTDSLDLIVKARPPRVQSCYFYAEICLGGRYVWWEESDWVGWGLDQGAGGAELGSELLCLLDKWALKFWKHGIGWDIS